ncbi:unnamed protein product [Moneuplotes crassus]|uniref:AP2/ERF domain-containing protein n=1 Tax=Euplotes crassus TaxID=5936 RepID=A0AAD1XRZ4_EUPCR|nr:unnamed protein product [Moneuplotes crassus]
MRNLDTMKQLDDVYSLNQVRKIAPEAQDYCLCSLDEAPVPSNFQVDAIDNSPNKFSAKFSEKLSKNILSKNQETQEEKDEPNKERIVIKKKKRYREELDITKKLKGLRWLILNQYITKFTSSRKNAKSSTKDLLRRRSKYIGVSRNNANWQALINVNKIKRYIGTFSSELQAAEAYDLYSFALRGEQAPLNFAYTPLQMLTKIETFLSHTPP